MRDGIRAALLDALAASEVQELSERGIATRAGISPTRFGEYYGDLSECMCDAFDSVSDDVYACFTGAFAEPGDAHAQLVQAIEQALERLLANPGAMRLWFVEARRTADPALQARRTAARDRLVEIITMRNGPTPEVPALHVEFLFGALAHAAHDELVGGGDCANAGRKVRELLALLEPVAA